MIFDTHSHYNDKQYTQDREAVLASLKGAGVTQVVNVSASWKDLLDTLELIQKVSFMYGAVGIHPDHVGELNEERLRQLREYCHRDKVVAVGEIGLDYHWNVEPKEVQQEWFVRQLHLATEEKLPVIIHSREASQDTFDIMKKEHAGTTGGVIHCFSGSAEMAKEYVKGSGKGYSFRAYRSRNGLSLSCTNTTQGKEKQFCISAVSYRRNREIERNYGRRSRKCNL